MSPGVDEQDGLNHLLSDYARGFKSQNKIVPDLFGHTSENFTFKARKGKKLMGTVNLILTGKGKIRGIKYLEQIQ